MIASRQDNNGVIVFRSITCPRIFTRERKKSDLSGASFMVCLSSIWWFLSNTLSISFFDCNCMRTSSKYKLTFSLKLSGRKILLINAENAAVPMEFP